MQIYKTRKDEKFTEYFKVGHSNGKEYRSKVSLFIKNKHVLHFFWGGEGGCLLSGSFRFAFMLYLRHVSQEKLLLPKVDCKARAKQSAP